MHLWPNSVETFKIDLAAVQVISLVPIIIIISEVRT